MLDLFTSFDSSSMIFLFQDHQHGGSGGGMTIEKWFGLFELPFLFLCIFYAFKTAGALKGGAFGKGMNLMAWGFLVMAVGHLAMQAQHHFGYDVFKELFGYTGGTIAWFVALVVTWSLSGLGFYQIYNASKGN